MGAEPAGSSAHPSAGGMSMLRENRLLVRALAAAPAALLLVVVCARRVAKRPLHDDRQRDADPGAGGTDGGGRRRDDLRAPDRWRRSLRWGADVHRRRSRRASSAVGVAARLVGRSDDRRGCGGWAGELGARHTFQAGSFRCHPRDALHRPRPRTVDHRNPCDQSARVIPGARRKLVARHPVGRVGRGRRRGVGTAGALVDPVRPPVVRRGRQCGLRRRRRASTRCG